MVSFKGIPGFIPTFSTEHRQAKGKPQGRRVDPSPQLKSSRCFCESVARQRLIQLSDVLNSVRHEAWDALLLWADVRQTVAERDQGKSSPPFWTPELEELQELAIEDPPACSDVSFSSSANT